MDFFILDSSNSEEEEAEMAHAVAEVPTDSFTRQERQACLIQDRKERKRVLEQIQTARKRQAVESQNTSTTSTTSQCSSPPFRNPNSIINVDEEPIESVVGLSSARRAKRGLPTTRAEPQQAIDMADIPLSMQSSLAKLKQFTTVMEQNLKHDEDATDREVTLALRDEWITIKVTFQDESGSSLVDAPVTVRVRSQSTDTVEYLIRTRARPEVPFVLGAVVSVTLKTRDIPLNRPFRSIGAVSQDQLIVTMKDCAPVEKPVVEHKGNKFSLKFRHQTGTHSLVVYEDEPLASTLSSVAKRIGVREDSLKFKFDGVIIKGTQTPKDIDIDEDDLVVDVLPA